MPSCQNTYVEFSKRQLKKTESNVSTVLFIDSVLYIFVYFILSVDGKGIKSYKVSYNCSLLKLFLYNDWNQSIDKKTFISNFISIFIYIIKNITILNKNESLFLWFRHKT